MKTNTTATPEGTRYCVERTTGMVGIVMPHEYMTLQVIDAWTF